MCVRNWYSSHIHTKKKRGKKKRLREGDVLDPVTFLKGNIFHDWQNIFPQNGKGHTHLKKTQESSFLFRLLVLQQPENFLDTRLWDFDLHSDSSNAAASSAFLVYQLNILTVSFPSGTLLFQWVLWFSLRFWEIFILSRLISSRLTIRADFPGSCCTGWDAAASAPSLGNLQLKTRAKTTKCCGGTKRTGKSKTKHNLPWQSKICARNSLC